VKTPVPEAVFSGQNDNLRKEPTVQTENPEKARHGKAPAVQNALLSALWVAEAALFFTDLRSGHDLSLLAYFILPSLVAAAFATPRQVLALVVAGLASGVASGLHFDILQTVPYLLRLAALALIGASAVVLSAGRARQIAATAAQADLVQAVLDSLLDPHILLRAVRDGHGRIIDFIFAEANEAACAYNRLPREKYIGRRLLELLPAHSASGLFDLYRRAIETGRPLALDDFLYPHEFHEQPRYYDIRAVKVGDALSFTWRDVTDRHEAVEKLQQHARTDELTKLLNRREVFEQLENLRGRTPRTGRHLAVLFVDFDRFKTINDTHGHAAGDEVLRITADRLRSCLRHHDDLGARVGGDEMMIVLHGVHGLPDAAAVAEKLRARAAEPMPVNGCRIAATVSIGVTLAHPGESTAALVARADEAMYRAKQHGRNQVITINGGSPA
jgi:diguanylate cyclase (GGDEF)-like protein